MKYLFFSMIVMAGLASCTSPKEKALGEIRKMEANDSVFSPQAMEESKKAYLEFAEKYPDDELAPEFIFKAAQRCNVSAEHEKALALFQSIIDKYPASKLCEESMFLQGYIYENNLHDYDRAKKIYLAFMKKYPHSELAEDAQISIDNLGKSPEEILEGFKHKKDSAGS